MQRRNNVKDEGFKKSLLFFILVGIIGRLVIHAPNFTPLISLCLFANTVTSKRNSFFLIGIILLLSDMCLHFFSHYPIFGSWTVFTYSGWFFVTAFGFLFAQKQTVLRALSFTVTASLFFWLWTNFGTWLGTNLYSHSLHGLMTCYIAALPFLRNSMLGSLVWTGVLLTSIDCFFRHDIIHRHIPTFRNKMI